MVLEFGLTIRRSAQKPIPSSFLLDYGRAYMFLTGLLLISSFYIIYHSSSGSRNKDFVLIFMIFLKKADVVFSSPTSQ